MKLLYSSAFENTDGFSEAIDTLVFEKMIGREASTSRLFAEYFLTRKAVEFLAASDSGLGVLTHASEVELSVEQKELLTSNLDDALTRVEELELSQERKSQIRSLLLAARTLSEAPEPPVGIIKELLSSADRVINIAGFFIGIAGLIIGLL